MFLWKRYEVCVTGAAWGAAAASYEVSECCALDFSPMCILFGFSPLCVVWLFSTVLLEQLGKLVGAAAAVYEVCPHLVSPNHPAQGGLHQQLCVCQNSKKF